MAYFKEPLCSEELILTEDVIKGIVSSLLAEMSEICCIGGQFMIDGKSMLEKWREEYALKFSEKYGVSILDIPGLDSLIAGMCKSIEGSLLGPYKPFVGLIQGVIKALKCPPKAPKNLRKMLQALLCYLDKIAKDPVKELLEAAILETIGDFAEKACIPIPKTEILIHMLLGEKDYQLPVILDKTKDALRGNGLKELTAEAKIAALETYWIIPSKLKKYASFKLAVFLKEEMTDIDANLWENIPRFQKDFKTISGVPGTNGLPKPQTILDLIINLLTNKIDCDALKQMLQEATVNPQDTLKMTAQLLKLDGIYGYTFVQFFEIIKAPITLARALVESLICLVKKLVSKPIKAIKEVVKIIKSPAKWMFDLMSDAISTALAGVVSGILGADVNALMGAQQALKAMIDRLFSKAPFQFPSLAEVCKAGNEIVQSLEGKLDEIVMVKIKGATTLILLLIGIIKAVLKVIFCIPKLLAWLFGKVNRKGKGEMTDDERAKYMEMADTPWPIKLFTMKYMKSFGNYEPLVMTMDDVLTGYFGYYKTDKYEFQKAVEHIATNKSVEYYDPKELIPYQLTIDMSDFRDEDENGEPIDFLPSMTYEDVPFAFMKEDASDEERLIDIIAYTIKSVDGIKDDNLEAFYDSQGDASMFWYNTHKVLSAKLNKKKVIKRSTVDTLAPSSGDLVPSTDTVIGFDIVGTDAYTGPTGEGECTREQATLVTLRVTSAKITSKNELTINVRLNEDTMLFSEIHTSKGSNEKKFKGDKYTEKKTTYIGFSEHPTPEASTLCE